jgi:hypothetical protein
MSWLFCSRCRVFASSHARGNQLKNGCISLCMDSGYESRKGWNGIFTRTHCYGNGMYHVVLMEDSVVIRKRNHHYCGLEEVVSCIVLE